MRSTRRTGLAEFGTFLIAWRSLLGPFLGLGTSLRIPITKSGNKYVIKIIESDNEVYKKSLITG